MEIELGEDYWAAPADPQRQVGPVTDSKCFIVQV